MAFTHITIFSILFATAFSQKLRFYAASQSGGFSNWKASKFVRSPTFTVCPDTLPKSFTLVCIPDNPAAYAEFYVNNELEKTERIVPYTIAGDFNGIARPWNPASSVKVECRLSDGASVSATINFVCDGAPVTPPQPPRPVSADPPSPPSFQLSSGSGSGSSTVVSTKDCVRIPATAAASLFKDRRENLGWERRGDALWFRPSDSSTGITAAGRVVATYKFKAPANGRFGFTLDMSTNGHVDHNDVWVRFEPNGFILTRGSSVKNSAGWTKAYHNSKGRSRQVYSVDFNPHSFATKDSLVKGKVYTVQVGGRSTKTGFDAIIMFPCSRSQCDGTDSSNTYWRSKRDKCGRSA